MTDWVVTSVSPGAGVAPSAAAPAPEEINNNTQPLDKFMEAGARGIVEAQQALDWHGRGRLLEWETEGLPPTVWTCASCRLKFGLAFSVRPKTRAAETTAVDIAPNDEARGLLSLSFRYIPTPQDEEADEA